MVSLCDHATADLARIPHQPAANIHALRTRMKKLRAVLRLVERRIDDASRFDIKSRIREIKNAFGQRRDAAVLEKLAARLRARKPGLPPLDFAVEGNLPDAEVAIEPLLPDLHHCVHSLREMLCRLPLQDLSVGSIAEAYARRYQTCRKAWKHCRKNPKPKKFHKWRKPVKELYYLSLVLHRRRDAQKRIRPTRKLAHWLGQEHDLQNLRCHLPPQEAAVWHKILDKKLAKLHTRIFKKVAKTFRHKSSVD